MYIPPRRNAPIHFPATSSRATALHSSSAIINWPRARTSSKKARWHRVTTRKSESSRRAISLSVSLVLEKKNWWLLAQTWQKLLLARQWNRNQPEDWPETILHIRVRTCIELVTYPLLLFAPTSSCLHRCAKSICVSGGGELDSAPGYTRTLAVRRRCCFFLSAWLSSGALCVRLI